MLKYRYGMKECKFFLLIILCCSYSNLYCQLIVECKINTNQSVFVLDNNFKIIDSIKSNQEYKFIINKESDKIQKIYLKLCDSMPLINLYLYKDLNISLNIKLNKKRKYKIKISGSGSRLNNFGIDFFKLRENDTINYFDYSLMNKLDYETLIKYFNLFEFKKLSNKVNLKRYYEIKLDDLTNHYIHQDQLLSINSAELNLIYNILFYRGFTINTELNILDKLKPKLWLNPNNENYLENYEYYEALRYSYLYFKFREFYHKNDLYEYQEHFVQKLDLIDELLHNNAKEFIQKDLLKLKMENYKFLENVSNERNKSDVLSINELKLIKNKIEMLKPDLEKEIMLKWINNEILKIDSKQVIKH